MMRGARAIGLVVCGWITLSPTLSNARVKLDALGHYLTNQGYGGAQLVDSGKFYHLPFRSNGKAGHLVVDTGSPASLIFRSSVKRLGLSETLSNAYVRGPVSHEGSIRINGSRPAAKILSSPWTQPSPAPR